MALVLLTIAGCSGVAEGPQADAACSMQTTTHPAAYCGSDDALVMKCSAPIANPGGCYLPSAEAGPSSDMWCCPTTESAAAVVVGKATDAPIASGYGRLILSVYPGQCKTGDSISVGVGDEFYRKYECGREFELTLDIAAGYPARVTTTVAGDFAEWSKTITPAVAAGHYQRVDQLVLAQSIDAPGSFTEYDSQQSTL